MKPRVVKSGCFWIVLRFGIAPGWEDKWTYNRCFDLWSDAVTNAITTTNGFKKVTNV